MLDLGLTTAPRPKNFADITAQTFEKDVLLASQKTPVIVQFWAPWCGPCKQLKPVLEKAVAAAADAVVMVRVNIDDCPDLAQALRVQSVPMVYAFYQGQPVDGFVGMRAESEISAFIAKLLTLTGAAPPEGAVDAEAVKKLMTDAATFFADGNTNEAMAAYSTAYDMDEKNAAALAGIAWCFVAQKDSEAFEAVAAELTPEQKADKAMSGILWLQKQRSDLSEQDVSNKNTQDHAARFDLAKAQIAMLDLEAAIDSLLSIVRVARDWENGRAREYLVALLDALGPAHPLTRPARRQLSSILFS